MLLPPAVEDFLNTSFDPDVEGYEVDTSLSTNANDSDDTRSSTPVMTPSDDFMLDPKNGLQLRSTDDPSSVTEPESEPGALTTPTSTILPCTDDPSSVTEPKSKPGALTTILPCADDPYESGSMMEPESELDPPAPVLAHVYDSDSITEPKSEPDTPTTSAHAVLAPVYNSDSITEPESELDVPTTAPSTVATPVHKPIFTTPSPPPPTSIYWKYVSKEEDAAWYDQSGKDDVFHAVHEIK